MIRVFIFALIVMPFLAKGQVNDVVVLKKRGYHVRSYTIGDELTVRTVYGQWVGGSITDLHHDSIFINHAPFHIKEIAAIRRMNYNFGNTVLATGLMVAGGGIFVLGAVNGAYRHDRSKDWYTTSGLITGASSIVVGYLLTKTRKKEYRMGRKYKLEYLELSFKPKARTSAH